MAEVIDPIWIAWAAGAEPRERTKVRLWRVQAHYEEAGAASALDSRGLIADGVGLATIALRDRVTSWPGLCADASVAGAYGYVPLRHGGRASAGGGEEAALDLARAILEEPERQIAESMAPLVAGAIDRPQGRLVIVNDLLGAGRLYEGSSEGLTVWSNRLGAIPLFLGEAPRPSPSGWRLFAAAAWFIGEPTSIEGVVRVPPGTVIEATRGGVERRATAAAEDAIEGLGIPREELLEAAVEGMRAAARGAARRDSEPLRIDLSGGRDSRLAAAAALAAGADTRLVTSDLVPGEADVARELVSRLADPPDHDVRWGGEERKEYDRDAMERARAVHLVHDGMRHAAKLRGKNDLPQPLPHGTTITGHGGEIAHGFYLTSARAMSRVESGGPGAALERLDGAARRSHSAARDDSYETAHMQFEKALAAGAALGLDPPRMLDWFYLMERFAHRSGLAADSGRVNLFAGAPFIRAAFSLSPAERLDATLHREAIARLVPAWRDVPFFAKPKTTRGSLRSRLSLRALRGPGAPVGKRTLIWEGDDGDLVGELVAAGGAWTELYDADRVRALWAAVRGGEENAHFQDVFEGIVYREAFTSHLELLATRAVREPSQDELSAVRLDG